MSCGPVQGDRGRFAETALRARATQCSCSTCATWPDCGPRNSCCGRDRKSTRLNSSHDQISYAVFCLKKKKKKTKVALHAIANTVGLRPTRSIRCSSE